MHIAFVASEGVPFSIPGRGQDDSAVRTGHPTRYVHATAFGDHRPQDRQGVHAAAGVIHKEVIPKSFK